MAITHDYLETTGFKPTVGEVAKAEIVLNLVDKTIWTKDQTGTVVELGKAYDDTDVLKDADALTAVNAGNKIITESDIAGLGGGDMLVSQYDTGGAYTNSVDSADTVLGKTVLTDVPALAVFTDTTYSGGTGITLGGSAFNHDSHTGDVTGSTALTIGAGKVTLAKMANIATDSFIGRDTAGTGVPEALSATAARAILNVENGAEQNNISDVNATDLTDGLDSALHYHSADRSRANHTGTQAHTTITGLGTASTVNTGTTSGTIPVLDGSNKIDAALLPALALTDVNTVASQVAQLALTVQEGDVAIRTDINTTYIHNGGVTGTMADWSEMQVPDAAGTNLAAGSVTDGTYEITSSTGNNITLPTATTSTAGMLSGALFDEIDANTTARHTHTNSAVLNATTASYTTADETKVDHLTVTAATNLDTIRTNSHTHSNKAVLDATTASFVTADETKLDHLTVTAATNLDTIRNNQIGSLLTGEAV